MSILSYSRYAFLTLCASVAFAAPVQAQIAFEDPGARGQPGGLGGDLRPVNERTDGGAVSLGAGAQVVVLLRNDDSKPIKVNTISLYPSSNVSASVGENQCAEAAILPGEMCAVSVMVKGLQQGNYRIEALIRHDGRAKLLTTTVSGMVESSGDQSKDAISDIEAIPALIDFGALRESRSQVKSVILRNITSKPVTIKNVSVEAGAKSGFVISEDCGELETGEACVATVNWSPEQRGASSGVIVIQHSGPTSVKTVELKGTYEPSNATPAEVFPQAVPGKGLLVSSREDVDFGSGVQQSSSITVSLVNVGDVPLTISGIKMSNNNNGVKTSSRGCKAGDVLAPIEACPLTLTWEPTRTGAIVDDIQIFHSGARGVLVLPLRGTAERAVNKDSKVILMGDPMDDLVRNIRPLSVDDIGESKTSSKNSAAANAAMAAAQANDTRNVLNGYSLTSFAGDRAILSSANGSRVIHNGEQTVIGGVLWNVYMKQNAVEFNHGDQKVLLLFDKSLSSVNHLGGQSTSGGSTIMGGGYTQSSPVSMGSAPPSMPMDSGMGASVIP
jgi:hypothetical protein